MNDLISRQMAIAEIKDYIVDPDKAISEYEDNVFNYNAGLKSAIQAVVDLPPAQQEPRWIPVTEQTLPRENSTVVAIGKTATWDVGNYRGHAESNIHRWYWKKNTMKDVYWWMYKKDALPKPYERSEE